MNQEKILSWIGLVIVIIGIALVLIWFDWKLLLVIFLLQWSNNIMMSNRVAKILDTVLNALKG